MIVDCHTHIDFGGERGGVSEHLSAAEKVDVSLVLACPGDSSQEVNKKLSEYVTRYKDKMAGFAVLDPTSDNADAKTLGHISDKLGLKGIVLHCSSCGFHPAHTRAMLLYEKAEELGLPVFFHNGCDLGEKAMLEYGRPCLVDEVARAFPRLKIVIGQMGQPFVEETLVLAAKHANIYADLTIRPSRVWQVYNTVMAAHEQGVMDKLLFGSGFPVSRAEECMEALLGFNKLMGAAELPSVPRGNIQAVIERDTLGLLGIKM